ncbi:MAG TPA: alpha/beta hydrolase [Prolixibacteraceae bacterium]|nr:alpha/beta hydrolase [Prolixibacteraceae bacterium]HOS91207.1 alpha/beta hydrolase [Prolixibacteraceae bacterium]HPL44816.1 alpha/beta hydrolase [Prolixibacteraceae bacterium]HQE53008.1 alpha/beta hydrolase [Prolixibacteraceae bacterium]HQH76110.1 alpha/beta hydrolase [Prolixibacteraceae bacterium]
MKPFSIICAIMLTASFSITAQEQIDLYQGNIPNSKKSGITETSGGFIRGVTIPKLEIYLPEKEKANGCAIIVIPGGGYSGLTYLFEGVRPARELANNGIAAFVLKYRLPHDSTMIDKKIGPLQDAQQALKLIRENASKWGIDPARIGLMGSSAGGHLASIVATRFEEALIDNKEGTSLRPDFMILIYPVTSMQDNLTHMDSRKALLGDNPSKDLIDKFSSELQVTEKTPPAYISHSGDDRLVDVDNSIVFYESMRHKKAPAEMHLYPRGGHGFYFGRPTDEWMSPLLLWLKNSKFISK